MTMDVTHWEAAIPWLDWREPVEIRQFKDATPHYACRICIATSGLHGRDIPKLPTDPEEVRQHIARAHVQQEATG